MRRFFSWQQGHGIAPTACTHRGDGPAAEPPALYGSSAAAARHGSAAYPGKPLSHGTATSGSILLTGRLPEAFLSPVQMLDLPVPGSTASSSSARGRQHWIEPKAEQATANQLKQESAIFTQFLALLNSTRLTLYHVCITSDLFIPLCSAQLQEETNPPAPWLQLTFVLLICF